MTAIDVTGLYSIHSRVKEIGLPLLGRPLLLSLVCMITYKNWTPLSPITITYRWPTKWLFVDIFFRSTLRELKSETYKKLEFPPPYFLIDQKES